MSQLCRLCLADSFDTANLSEYREGFPISTLVMVILPIKIHEKEKKSLPKIICSSCLEIVVNAYKLRDVSLKSERILMSSSSEYLANVKVENTDSDSIFFGDPKLQYDDEFLEEYDTDKSAQKQRTVEVEESNEAYIEGYSIDLYRKDKTPKTSMVWRYFGRLLDSNNKPTGQPDNNYCILCLQNKKIFKYSKTSATTTLLMHLEATHKITRDGDPALLESYYKRKKREETSGEKKTQRAPKGSNASSTICSECGKSFSAYHILTKHMRIHSGKNFSCRRCPSRFSFRENLQRHEKIHDPNHLSRFICDACGSSYAEIKSLKHHIMRVHLNVPVEKKFVCNIEGCNMKFEKSFTLKKHMMTHSSLKPHECTYCDNAYASKGDLFKHLQKIHVGDNLWSCEFCNASFRFKIQLREHYQVHYTLNENNAKAVEAN